VFVSTGGAYANFRRALDTRNLTIIRSAAAEIPQVPLDDALRICLILRNAEPVAYDRAVLRWLARFAREKAFSLGQLKVAIAAFEGLAENPARSERQLRGLLDRPG
jgi:hypothetical protein